MFRAGDRVGDYEIVARLKGGGMATLFLARRVGASGFIKHVAIKVVHAHLAEDPNFVQMFVDEALLSAQIQHPNVVHVEELREIDGAHFLVMEFVSGCALSHLLRELAKRGRRLSPQLAVHIAVRVADGLHAAHELRGPNGAPLGVVHRDVSPQNVLLAWEGHVKLIDFGVAKARFRSMQTTGATLKGKIRYMAPEQATGRAVDRRSDIYALGVVLWEMLTMKRLFNADNDFALLEVVRSPHVIPPSHIVPDVSPDLDRVVMTALQPDAEHRYQTAQQLRRELADAMPRAVALDASHLSELLVTVMEAQIAQARATLPASVTGLDVAAMGVSVEPDEVLRTMTISATGVDFFADMMSDQGANSPPQPASGPVAAGGGTPVLEASPPSRSRRMMLGLVVTSVLALVLGAAVTVVVGLSSRPAPTVTHLAGESRSPLAVDAADEPEGDAGSAVAASHPVATPPDAGPSDAGPAPTKLGRRHPRQRPIMGSTMMATMMSASMDDVPLVDDFGF